MDETHEQTAFIFGVIFDMANKLQVIGDRFLGQDGMTTKQWLLTLVVEQYGNRSPTLGEVAKQLGTSHQNAKQIALKLENKGFLKIGKDPDDGRTLRLEITEKSRDFWDRRQDKDHEFIAKLFLGLEAPEIGALYSGIRKLHRNIKSISENEG